MPEQHPTSVRIAIFRVGSHTAMSGLTRTYSADDLAAAAASYDPALFEAPLVVGHPESNTPAFGWVRRLALEGDTLWAEADQLDPAFVEAVRAGRYKKISAAFYLPDAPHNPVPGVLYLRHVGFLGGAAPAVKGLPQVQFGAARQEEFAVYGCAECLTQFVQDATQDAQQDAQQDPSIDPPTPAVHPIPPKETTMSEQDQAAYAEAVKERDAIAAENARLKAEIDDLRASAAKREREARHAANLAFVESMVSAGRVPVGIKDVLTATLDALSGQEAVTFGEGDAAKPLAAAFREALSSLPAMADTAEHAVGPAKTPMTRAEFEAMSPEQRMAAVKAGATIA